VQPGVRALDRPALRELRIGSAALATSPPAGDRGRDPALDERGAQGVTAVAAVGEQAVGTVVAAARAPAQRRDRVDQGEQLPALVLVAGREADAQGDAASVAAEVELR
jgi:hypothetical protein